jgi:hypothetical protein
VLCKLMQQQQQTQRRTCGKIPPNHTRSCKHQLRRTDCGPYLALGGTSSAAQLVLHIDAATGMQASIICTSAPSAVHRATPNDSTQSAKSSSTLAQSRDSRPHCALPYPFETLERHQTPNSNCCCTSASSFWTSPLQHVLCLQLATSARHAIQDTYMCRYARAQEAAPVLPKASIAAHTAPQAGCTEQTGDTHLRRATQAQYTEETKQHLRRTSASSFWRNLSSAASARRCKHATSAQNAIQDTYMCRYMRAQEPPPALPKASIAALSAHSKTLYPAN